MFYKSKASKAKFNCLYFTNRSISFCTRTWYSLFRSRNETTFFVVSSSPSSLCGSEEEAAARPRVDDSDA